MFDKRDHIYIIAIRVKRLHVENGKIKRSVQYAI